MHYYCFDKKTGKCKSHTSFKVTNDDVDCIECDEYHDPSKIALVDGKIVPYVHEYTLDELKTMKSNLVVLLGNRIQHLQLEYTLVNPHKKADYNKAVEKYKELYNLKDEELTIELLESFN